MTERMTGYTLLISGVLIILFSFFSVISVFTKRTPPVQLFNMKGITLDSSALAPQMDFGSIPGMNNTQTTPAKPIELFPSEDLNTSANIFAHLMFMGFLLSVGAKIASLGTDLLRPIVIKSSQKTVPLQTEP